MKEQRYIYIRAFVCMRIVHVNIRTSNKFSDSFARTLSSTSLLKKLSENRNENQWQLFLHMWWDNVGGWGWVEAYLHTWNTLQHPPPLKNTSQWRSWSVCYICNSGPSTATPESIVCLYVFEFCVRVSCWIYCVYVFFFPAASSKYRWIKNRLKKKERKQMFQNCCHASFWGF